MPAATKLAYLGPIPWRSEDFKETYLIIGPDLHCAFKFMRGRSQLNKDSYVCDHQKCGLWADMLSLLGRGEKGRAGFVWGHTRQLSYLGFLRKFCEEVSFACEYWLGKKNSNKPQTKGTLRLGWFSGSHLSYFHHCSYFIWLWGSYINKPLYANSLNINALSNTTKVSSG